MKTARVKQGEEAAGTKERVENVKKARDHEGETYISGKITTNTT